MKEKSRHLEYSSILNRYRFILALIWTLTIAISFTWNYIIEYDNAEHAAIISARAQFTKDVIYRRWNAGHGGVYVPISKDNQPNPYLAQVKERDIETLSGRRLTLINPAYMTRQVHKLGFESKGIRGHITSLKPIRPENAPDTWEKKALTTFGKGRHEYYSVEVLDNTSYMRLMRPLITEKGCLNCHSQQGYKEGDIRGGISVSTPMNPYLTIASEQIKIQFLVHFIFLLLGLLGIFLGIREAKKRSVERDNLIVMLKKEEERNADVLVGTNAGTWDWNIQTGEVILNERWAEISGHTLKELEPIDINTWTKNVHPDDLPIANASIIKHLNRETNYYDTEFRQHHKNNTWVWVNARGKVVEWASDGKPLRMSGTHLDITERKLVEEKLEKSLKKTEQMNMLMTGREMRVIEMKKEVNALLIELGREPKYKRTE